MDVLAAHAFWNITGTSGTLQKYRLFTFYHSTKPCNEYLALSVIILIY